MVYPTSFMTLRYQNIPGPLAHILQETGMELRLNKHPKRRNNLSAAAMYEMYKDGSSLQKIGIAFGKTRQCIYDILRSRGYELRSKTMKDLVVVDGIRWTWSKGGLRGTSPAGRRLYLHTYIWEKTHGPIAPGYNLHFKNWDRKDVRIDNLELLSIPEINKRFNPHNNQHKRV